MKFVTAKERIFKNCHSRADDTFISIIPPEMVEFI